MKSYNVNELLELKQELDTQILDKSNIRSEELVFKSQEIRDFTNSANNRTIETRPKININEFIMQPFSLIDKLAKVKQAIQKHNADQVLGLLQERESLRNKIGIIQNVILTLPKSASSNRETSRRSKEGETQETVDTKSEPMFKLKNVEKIRDQLAAEERKINTDIQRINLNAKIELSGLDDKSTEDSESQPPGQA